MVLALTLVSAPGKTAAQAQSCSSVEYASIEASLHARWIDAVLPG